MPTSDNAYNRKSITIYKNRYYIFEDMILEKIWRDSNRQNYRFQILNSIEKNIDNIWIDLDDFQVAYKVKELGKKKDFSLKAIKTLYGKVFI